MLSKENLTLIIPITSSYNTEIGEYKRSYAERIQKAILKIPQNKDINEISKILN